MISSWVHKCCFLKGNIICEKCSTLSLKEFYVMNDCELTMKLKSIEKTESMLFDISEKL